MSQGTQSVRELVVATERLQNELAAVQLKLAGHAAVVDVSQGDVWDVWPYNWAASGWDSMRIFSCRRFHWLHQNLKYHILRVRNSLRPRSAAPGELRLV